MKDLAERIMGLTEPDRGLEAEIYHDVLGFCRHKNTERTGAQSDTGFDCLDCGADSWGNLSRRGDWPKGQRLHFKIPAYTVSADAALSLARSEEEAQEAICWAVQEMKKHGVTDFRAVLACYITARLLMVRN